MSFRICDRCGHVRALHWNPNAWILRDPPICDGFKPRPRWPTRLLRQVRP